jgi:CheY-like chemotaxis protein
LWKLAASGRIDAMSIRRSLVAIVDDEPSIGRALVRLLKSAHFRAEAFTSGADFLASLPRSRPDCVVLDLQMPLMTGIEVQERLAQEQPAPPSRRPAVIVITAYDEPGTREQCMALGAACYLRKPIEGDTLLESIREVLRAG